MSSLAALRAQLAAIVPPPAVVDTTIGTGLPALDAALPGGGIPCGRLTEIAGASGSGATSLARALVAAAISDKLPVAYIDATRTLAPRDWAPLATTGLLWVVRPPPHTPGQGTWCADVLLRSGAFRLVVLDDTAPIPRAIIVRLTRLAQDVRAALVVVHHHTAGRGLVGSALRLEMRRTDPTPASPGLGPRHAWRRLETRLTRAARGLLTPERPATPSTTPARTIHPFTCTISRGSGENGPRTVEVTCAIDLTHRLCADPAIPDRRGVAPRNRLGERATADTPGARRTTPPPDGVGGAITQRKRRCAEPVVRRDAFLLDPVDPRATGTTRG